MRRFVAPSLGLAAVLALASVASCRRGEYEKPCGQLPDVSACPVLGGGTCADVTCSAIYSCNDGAWSLREVCNQGDAGADADAAGDAKPDAFTCGDASLPDAGTAGAICDSLQPPDCDYAAAKACPAGACNGACDGFLACTSDGWSGGYVAYCDDDGQLVVVK